MEDANDGLDVLWRLDPANWERLRTMRGREIREFPTRESRCINIGERQAIMAYDATGEQLAMTIALESEFTVWKGRPKQFMCQVLGQGAVIILCMAFHPQYDDRLVTGSHAHQIHVWDIRRRKLMSRMKGHYDRLLAISFDPVDGSRLFSCAMDAINVWDFETGKTVDSFTASADLCCWAKNIAVDRTGNLVAAACHGGYVRVWDTRAHKALHELHDTRRTLGTLLSVAFHPTRQEIAAAGQPSPSLLVWSLHGAADKPIFTAGTMKTLYAVSYDTEGHRMVCGGVDNAITVYDASSPAYRHLRVIDTKRPVLTVEIDPSDNTRAAAAECEWDIGDTLRSTEDVKRWLRESHRPYPVTKEQAL